MPKKINKPLSFSGYTDLELRVLADALDAYLQRMITVVNDARARDPEGYAQVRKLWDKACDMQETVRIERATRTAAEKPLQLM